MQKYFSGRVTGRGHSRPHKPVNRSLACGSSKIVNVYYVLLNCTDKKRIVIWVYMDAVFIFVNFMFTKVHFPIAFINSWDYRRRVRENWHYFLAKNRHENLGILQK